MKRRLFPALLALCLAAGLLSGCGQQNGTQGPAPVGDDSFSVVDMRGREVTFDHVPKTIAALQASDVEVLYAIGAGDQLMGVGEYCNYPADAQQKAVLASGGNTNIEQIISLAPDVLVVGKMAQTTQQVQQLTDAGIPVVMTDPQDIEGTYEAIQLMGRITGREKEARNLVDQMKDGFDVIRQKAHGGDLTVYFEVSPLEYGLWAAGGNTFMEELCDMLGARNIFSDIDGWQQVSEEQVLERDPDVIITVTMYAGEGPTPVEEIAARPGWQNVKAVQNGRIYQADNDELTRPGPRLVDAAEALYGFLYEDTAA